MTSNLESSIDPALSRRLSFELRFPFPDEEQRGADVAPHAARRAAASRGDIDFAALAKRFELAGGYIRNIVLRAAYLAASDGRTRSRWRTSCAPPSTSIAITAC